MTNGQLLEEVLTKNAGKRHVYISIGKGGVGKTTVSMMAGLLLSRKGRTLIASLDPAKHLLGYLGIDTTGKIEKVAPNLYAVQYDVESYAKKLSDEYSILLRQVLPGLRIINMEQVADSVRNAPGFEEEVFLRIMIDLYEDEKFDYVVIDTPPTGITHRILNLPRLYLFWLNQLYQIREKIVSLRYTIARTLKQEYKPEDPVLDKIYSMIKRYEKLHAKMTDPNTTSVLIIATPEPLPVFEAKESLKLMKRLKINTRAIIVNRVLPSIHAKNIGVHSSQIESIKSILDIDCDCWKIAVMHHTTPPKTLQEVSQMLGLVKNLQEVLKKLEYDIH